ncbi:unnamed protein product [Angiostrongylus costaricensis]|uniref:Uncharacterized protein n=1 Tax=Angiostrongylus costaricensis TaxID=334426 RepID=A0A0R3PGM7_ANGCS|nr:unnamed protein product [Angiostrongylus costaricensis]
MEETRHSSLAYNCYLSRYFSDKRHHFPSRQMRCSECASVNYSRKLKKLDFLSLSSKCYLGRYFSDKRRHFPSRQMRCSEYGSVDCSRKWKSLALGLLPRNPRFFYFREQFTEANSEHLTRKLKEIVSSC